MLTDEEKNRIRLEEIFREEVRKDLVATNAKTRTERIWAFLNMPFMLWFLSSVLLALSGWTFSTLQANAASSEKKRETIEKLDTEISSRVMYSVAAVQALKARMLDGYLSVGEAYVCARMMEGLDASARMPDQSMIVFQDFKGRSLPSLLAELLRLVEKAERAELRAAQVAYRQVQTCALGDGFYSAGGEKRPASEVANMVSLADKALKNPLGSAFALKRWGEAK